MTHKYAVLNPNNGEYTLIEGFDNACAAIAENALNFYLAHAHNSLYANVTVNDDGTQTWTDTAGEQIPNQTEIRAIMERRIAELQRAYGALPVSTL